MVVKIEGQARECYNESMEIHPKIVRKLTTRQMLALGYWKKDKFGSMAKAIRNAGYSEAIARQPHKVFGSPAVKRELLFLGIGAKLTKHQKEHGKTIEQWSEEKRKEEAENAKMKEKVDQLFNQLAANPEQIAIFKERLMEAGYNPYKTPVLEKEIPSFVPNGKVKMIRRDDNLQSFSSM